MLAALSREDACVCGVSKRVKSSSAAFLPLPHTLLETRINQLWREGLIEPEAHDACSEGCERRFHLTSQGKDALREFLNELQAWGLGGPGAAFFEVSPVED